MPEIETLRRQFSVRKRVKIVFQPENKHRRTGVRLATFGDGSWFSLLYGR